MHKNYPSHVRHELAKFTPIIFNLDSMISLK